MSSDTLLTFLFISRHNGTQHLYSKFSQSVDNFIISIPFVLQEIFQPLLSLHHGNLASDQFSICVC